MKIFIGCDHRGIDAEKYIVDNLKLENIDINIIDLKNYDTDDYPDFAFKVCQEVLNSSENLGILICGNGIGMSIAANKVKGIRAARAVNELDAYNARIHNGANVLCLGSDIDNEVLMNIVKRFITTNVAFEEKHLNRIDKIIKYENGEYNEL